MEKASCIDISKLNILGTIRHKKFALKQKNTELKHTHLKKIVLKFGEHSSYLQNK
jgi:hypothetical protein